MNNKLIKILIELNIKINKDFIYLDNFTNLVILLKEALLENNQELVNYLLKAGLALDDIEKYDKSLSSIFREVILKKNIELCNVFLSNNVKLNIKDKNYFGLLDLVFLSVKKNDFEMSRICILAGIWYRLYNASKFNIANIFLLACHFNQTEIIKFFFTEEFNIAYPDFDVSYTLDNGETGLISLIKHKNLEAIKFILNQEKKIDINKINLDESSALTHACKTNLNHCNDEIISILIQNGADVNQITMFNKNALILSIEQNNSEIISLLIDSGANFDNIINKEMYIDSILQIGHYEIIELLQKSVSSNSLENQIKHRRKRGPINFLISF